MSKQATLKINNSLERKMLLLGQTAEDVAKDKLISIAQTAVTASPVDTGAYVTSHSFKTDTTSRGRGKSSANKPRGQNPEVKRREGFDNLMYDISTLDLKTLKKVTLRNDSPHAQEVEYKHGYAVYTIVRNLHG
jgi:hypothetical protein